MIYSIVRLFLIAFFMAGVFSASMVSAASLSSRLSGRILLQVEDKGKAWYVDPSTKDRAYLGRPADAFRAMRELGLGITNADLDRIVVSDDGKSGDTKFARKLAGKIVLQVQSKGEAWYVNPVDLKRYYLGRPADAFSIMRELGLGVSNKDIEKISVKSGYQDLGQISSGIQTQVQAQPPSPSLPSDQIQDQTPAVVLEDTKEGPTEPQTESTPTSKSEVESVTQETQIQGQESTSSTSTSDQIHEQVEEAAPTKSEAETEKDRYNKAIEDRYKNEAIFRSLDFGTGIW